MVSFKTKFPNCLHAAVVAGTLADARSSLANIVLSNVPEKRKNDNPMLIGVLDSEGVQIFAVFDRQEIAKDANWPSVEAGSAEFSIPADLGLRVKFAPIDQDDVDRINNLTVAQAKELLAQEVKKRAGSGGLFTFYNQSAGTLSLILPLSEIQKDENWTS